MCARLSSEDGMREGGREGNLCPLSAASVGVTPSPPPFRTELFPYSRVIFYTVITAMVSYDRVALKKAVVDAPEVGGLH